jgi:uncharacterized membrane protein YgcG
VAEAASGSDVATADVVGAFKVLKVPKLLRMGRLFKFLERFEGAANAGRIFLLMLLMTLIVHWISCLWYLFARSPGGFLDQHGPGSDAAWYDQYLFNFYTVRAFGVDEESRQRRNSEDGPRRRLGSCSGGRRSSSAVGGGGEGGGGGGDYEGVRAAQQRLEGKIDEIYRMLRTQKTRDDA